MTEPIADLYPVELVLEYAPADGSFTMDDLTRAIRQVMAAHEVEAGTSVTLVITSDEMVQSLNAAYRGVDAPTDILSFPADPLPDEILGLAEEDGEEPDLPAEDDDEEEEIFESPYLGDLIIAYPYTARHAAESGHPIRDEFMLLCVHGTLHLLGYDHDTAENQARMWAKQAALLSALGVNITVDQFTFGESADA